MDSSDQAESLSLSATKDKSFDVQIWNDRINKARNKEQSWRERAKKIIKIYRDDDTITDTTYSSPRPNDDTEYCFNILFANVETLLPALFSSTPKPDVRNRYLNQDKISETAGDVIERCLLYLMDTYGFKSTIKAIVKDHLLTGRGTVRVRYIPTIETQKSIGIDEKGEMVEHEKDVIKDQKIICEGVDWDALVIEPCKKWEDVSWIAFIHMLSREEFLEYFPHAPLIEADKKSDEFSPDSKYRVVEVWDKPEKKVYFMSKSELLGEEEDPLKLTKFWPIPEPLYSVKTSDTLVPIPEYTIYQTLAEELNQLTYRISDLTRACKFQGIYDAMEPEIERMFDSKDSEFVPVTSGRMAQGGTKTLVDVIDTSQLARVIGELNAQRTQCKEIIYEVTGISDIIRGQSVATETATAQNIKASYAGLRLRDRRDNIDTFIVELLRIMSEILCEFFTSEQLQAMSGIQVTPDVENILRNDVLRNYNIDIESDSTLLPDMQAQSQQRAALVGSITQFLTAAAPLVAQGAVPVETAKALLLFAVQPAKISRELQDALELIGQPPPPPPPPPPQPQGMPGMPPQMGGMPPQGMPPGPPGGMPMPQGAPQGLPPELMGLHPQA